MAKFSETSGWTPAFQHWGYPVWFRWTVGAVELTASACLLWGRTAVIGASLILVVMAGAMATKVIQDGGSHVTSDIVPSIFALIILFMRREQLARLFRKPPTSPGSSSTAP